MQLPEAWPMTTRMDFLSSSRSQTNYRRNEGVVLLASEYLPSLLDSLSLQRQIAMRVKKPESGPINH